MKDATLDEMSRRELAKLQDANAEEQRQLQGRIVKARVRYNRTGRPEDLEMLKRLIAERKRVKDEGHRISGAWARAEMEYVDRRDEELREEMRGTGNPDLI